jgi:hypothetical protein
MFAAGGEGTGEAPASAHLLQQFQRECSSFMLSTNGTRFYFKCDVNVDTGLYI